MNMVARTVPAETGDDIRQMLRQSVRDFSARHPGVARTRRLRDTQPGLDRGIWRAMAEAGWTGIGVAEAHGGSGLGLAEICAVAEELASDLAPEPFAPATLATLAIAGGDNTAFQRRLLPVVAEGGLIPALAWQETPNGIDPLNITAPLSVGGDGLVLTGEKRFVPSAGGADGFVVTAKSSLGPVLVWVAADAQGLTIRPDAVLDGGTLSTIRFEDVRIAERDIVASAKAAQGLLPRLIDEALLIASAELLGIMRTALARTLDYSRQRVQFGKPIGSFQALQHRMVDLWMQQQLAEACLEQALEVFATTSDAFERAVAASAAKARASAAAVLIGRQSIQLHGAIGYADEHDIGLFLKRAVVKSAWLGTAATHRRRFGDLLESRQR